MKIKITRLVTSEFDLTRTPTKEELVLLKHRDFFDFENPFINWDSEEMIEEDYSNCAVKVDINDKIVLNLRYNEYLQ